jgi:hypothetical protein
MVSVSAFWFCPSDFHANKCTLLSTGSFSTTFDLIEDENGCSEVIHHFNPLIHKPKYRVGVFARQGEDQVMKMYSKLFTEYLTMTAGMKFNPPVEFELVAFSILGDIAAMAEEETIDFFYADPSVLSCMDIEFGAQALATIINRQTVR